MKMKPTSSDDFLCAVSGDMTAEEMLLAGMQGIIAAQITMKRQELELTQQQLADMMGVTQALVCRWEAGECNYTLSTLVKIASKLDIEFQCPLKPSPAPVYLAPGTTNIYHLPDSGWVSGGTTSPEYSQSVDELKEM